MALEAFAEIVDLLLLHLSLQIGQAVAVSLKSL